MIFMGPVEQDKVWNDSALRGIHKFIQRVEVLCGDDYLMSANTVTQENESLLHKTIK
ncbi:MAG: hypothetical protein H6765_02820 [Candidatus Peribacteria bacterium]|nr:MAG: hypothetical protein H6765_02820 [Candidatus Peribacteria bacterium]